MEASMTTLREAAQQALEALHEIAWCNDSRWQTDRAESVIPALRDALEQQEQEPKAWMLTDDSGMRFVSVDRPHPDFVPLYTAPPRREWRNLTMQEINALPEIGGVMWRMGTSHAVVRALRAVEAALKGKNA
jgi:hypothetical protein